MSGSVPSQDILRRITEQSAAGSRYVDFKDVMMTMVDSFTFEIYLYETFSKVITRDIINLRENRMKRKVMTLSNNSLYIYNYIFQKCGVRYNPKSDNFLSDLKTQLSSDTEESGIAIGIEDNRRHLETISKSNCKRKTLQSFGRPSKEVQHQFKVRC